MSGMQFAVVQLDPITGQPTDIFGELNWNLGDAAAIAETTGGKVVYAIREPWAPVPDEAVAQALEATKQRTMDSELKQMLDQPPE